MSKGNEFVYLDGRLLKFLRAFLVETFKLIFKQVAALPHP
ncbi:MAG: hypothetical protein ACJATE_000096 [Bacteroidia bacterium]|jgi:hypothetical protein